MDLTQQDILRYTRQLSVIGMQGQRRLKQAKVLCIGAGGLGSPALQYLAVAGIGTLGIVDGDVVELSNLQRQVLFTEETISNNKAESAAARLRAMNSHIDIVSVSQSLTEDNAASLIASYDVVIDATDNFVARYLMNRHCRLQGIPLISASVFQTQAQLSVFNFNGGPCYECLYPVSPPSELAPNCATAGVLGVVPGLVGILQANEVIKIVLGQDGVLSGVLLAIEVTSLQFQRYSLHKQSICRPDSCSQLAAVSNTLMENKNHLKTVSCMELAQWLQEGKPCRLVDVREPYEREICHLGGYHVPLYQLSRQAASWPLEEPIVVYCKAGMRSQRAAVQLQSLGFTQVYSLEGGVLAWIEQVDTTLMRY